MDLDYCFCITYICEAEELPADSLGFVDGDFGEARSFPSMNSLEDAQAFFGSYLVSTLHYWHNECNAQLRLKNSVKFNVS